MDDQCGLPEHRFCWNCESEGIIKSEMENAKRAMEERIILSGKAFEMRDALDWAIPLLVDRRGSLSDEDKEKLKAVLSLAAGMALDVPAHEHVWVTIAHCQVCRVYR